MSLECAGGGFIRGSSQAPRKASERAQTAQTPAHCTTCLLPHIQQPRRRSAATVGLQRLWQRGPAAAGKGHHHVCEARACWVLFQTEAHRGKAVVGAEWRKRNNSTARCDGQGPCLTLHLTCVTAPPSAGTLFCQAACTLLLAGSPCLGTKISTPARASVRGCLAGGGPSAAAPPMPLRPPGAPSLMAVAQGRAVAWVGGADGGPGSREVPADCPGVTGR